MKFMNLVLTVISVFSASVSNAANMSGVVSDKSGRPLSDVSIITDVAGIATSSDIDGRYLLQSDSVTRLTFSSVGFKPRQFSAGNVPDTVMLEVMFFETDGIVVTAARAQSGVDGIAFSNVTSNDIKRDYSVGEFPLLLESTPNLYAFTDGGAPLGYSYLSIRGFNDQRIATYINGVPLNDPEDHFTYFVDLPDLGSSISDIQVQRGVGNSPYGDAAFGGSINIATSVFAQERTTRLVTGYGEFTHDGNFFGRQISKQSLEFGSGLVDGRWSYYGRFSRQSTSGYRDASWYNGWSYYMAVGRLDPRMSTELHVYGGPIRTHLSFFGVSRDVLESNRLTNPLSYANETDNFNQPHYQIHNRYLINDKASLSTTLYYIRGKGFFEQFKNNRQYSEYNLSAFSDSATGDLVRRKQVEKNQIGLNSRLDIEHEKGRHTLGGSIYFFDSDHWGEVVSAEHLTRSIDPTHRYYQYFGKKTVASIYVQEQRSLSNRLTLQATTQLRYSRFTLDQVQMGAFAGYQFTVDWLFVSPRIGFNYSLSSKTNIYANFAISSRAPNDDNIFDADNPDATPLLETLSGSGGSNIKFGDPLISNERAYDIEFGINRRTDKAEFAVNLFWLQYDNEYLFDFGADAVDSLTTLTIPRSYHSGIEISGKGRPNKIVQLSGSFSYNVNRIVDYPANFGTEVVSFNDKTVPDFPEYLGNLIVDVSPGSWRLTARWRFAGKQYMEPQNIDSLAVDAHINASLTMTYEFKKFLGLGSLSISGTINNLYNNKYIASGYGGNFLAGPNNVQGWAEYFVAPERSFWGQVALELF